MGAVAGAVGSELVCIPSTIGSPPAPATAPLNPLPCGCPPRPPHRPGSFTHRDTCAVYTAALAVRRAADREAHVEFKAKRLAHRRAFLAVVSLRDPLSKAARPRPPRPTLTCRRCGKSWSQYGAKPPRRCRHCSNDWRYTADEAKALGRRRRRRSGRRMWARKSPEERAAWASRIVLARGRRGVKRDPLELDDDAPSAKKTISPGLGESSARFPTATADAAPRASGATPNLCSLGKCAHPSCRRLRGERA